MENITQLIAGALLQGEKTLQKQSEQQLVTLLGQNPVAFVETMTHILHTGSFPSDIRQGAGALLKRSINFVDPAIARPYWLGFPEEAKVKVKDRLLATLMDKDTLVRRATSDCISNVFALEMDAWPHLIPVLLETAGNADPLIQKTSVMTLGFICEQLKERGQISLSIQENIVKAIFCSIQSPAKELRTTALKALRDSIGFLREMMLRPELRAFIVKSLFENSGEGHEEDERELGMQGIIEVCKHYYTLLEDCMSFIYAATIIQLQENKAKSHGLIKLIVEVWGTLATEYRELKKNKKEVVNYIGSCEGPVVTLFLRCLGLYSTDDDDLNSISSTAEYALTEMGSFISLPSLGIITTSVSQLIKQLDWHQRRTAILAYSTILQSDKSAEVQTYCLGSLGEIVRLLADPVLEVREAASKTISRVAQVCPNCLFARFQQSSDLDLILSSLDDNSAVVRNTCWTICYLAQALGKTQQKVLRGNARRVIECLLKNAVRGDANESQRTCIDICFMAMFNMIDYLSEVGLANEYIQVMLGQLTQVKSKPVNIRQEAYLSGLFTILHSCLMVNVKELLNTHVLKVPKDLLLLVYSEVVRMFNLYGDVLSDGFYIVGSIFYMLGPASLQYLQSFWPFVSFALNSFNNIELFKSAVNFLGDIARALNDKLPESKLQIIKHLMEYIYKSEYDRQAKIVVFSVLGDFVLSTKEKFVPYIRDSLNIFNLGFSATVELAESGSDPEYREQLVQTLLDSFQCLVCGIGVIQSTHQIMIGQLPRFLEFIKYSCNPRVRPSFQVVITCLNIVADLLKYYGQRCRGLVQPELVAALKDLLRQNLPDNLRHSAQEACTYIDKQVYHLK